MAIDNLDAQPERQGRPTTQKQTSKIWRQNCSGGDWESLRNLHICEKAEARAVRPACHVVRVRILLYKGQKTRCDLHLKHSNSRSDPKHESITIRVYDDRVLIRNPGGLPGGITVEQLKQEPHPTVPRNPLLANVFYYAELVEKWGSGTTRIVGLCREQGVPEPVYETTPTSFEVEFTRESSKARPSGYSLKEGQLQALAFLEEHGRITNAQYQELAGVKKRQATNDLTDLERKGIVERAGTTGRGTYYVLRGAAKGQSIGQPTAADEGNGQAMIW